MVSISLNKSVMQRSIESTNKNIYNKRKTLQNYEKIYLQIVSTQYLSKNDSSTFISVEMRDVAK